MLLKSLDRSVANLSFELILAYLYLPITSFENSHCWSNSNPHLLNSRTWPLKNCSILKFPRKRWTSGCQAAPQTKHIRISGGRMHALGYFFNNFQGDFKEQLYLEAYAHLTIQTTACSSSIDFSWVLARMSQAPLWTYWQTLLFK